MGIHKISVSTVSSRKHGALTFVAILSEDLIDKNNLILFSSGARQAEHHTSMSRSRCISNAFGGAF